MLTMAQISGFTVLWQANNAFPDPCRGRDFAMRGEAAAAAAISIFLNQEVAKNGEERTNPGRKTWPMMDSAKRVRVKLSTGREGGGGGSTALLPLKSQRQVKVGAQMAYLIRCDADYRLQMKTIKCPCTHKRQGCLRSKASRQELSLINVMRG